jgi:orotidine-5'-phosphate decarboxylase
MDNPIIVALDGMDVNTAHATAEKLSGHVWGFKANDLLLTMEVSEGKKMVSFSGLAVAQGLTRYGNLMLDPKIHDIPKTAKNDGSKLQKIGAKIVTVHASGGSEMLKTAEIMLPGCIAAVTLLTSISSQECRLMFRQDPETLVKMLAMIAEKAGVSYLVCSALELDVLSDISVPKIVPGIRPRWYQEADDQKRTATPAEAMEKGAKFLVMGRPILKDPDPVAAAQKTLDEIKKG